MSGQGAVAAGVGLVAACDDPDLFGFPLWPRQRERLAQVEAGPRLHVWADGRRSSKTTRMALVGLWCCLLRPELLEFLRPGERGWTVGVATNHRQARLLVRQAVAIVERSPLLAPLVESVTEDEILFANGTGFAAFPCSSRGGRGWPIFAFLMDEAAHFVSETEGPGVAEHVFEALAPSTAQFGNLARIIVGSTPYGSAGFFAELWHRADSGELADAVAARAASAEMNPTLSSEFLEQERARDPESFPAEYEGEFLGSGGAFLDPENVEAVVTLPGELVPTGAVDWIGGLDPAFASDLFGLVLVGRDPFDQRRLLTGLVRSWMPPRRKAASLEEGREIEDMVLAEVAQVLRLFGARAVTDQYKSAGVKERLQRYGIPVRAEAMTAPMKDAAFGFLRGRVNDGSLELYEHPDLLRELRALRTRYTAGRSSVVLPRIGRGHCDHAQALALAVFEHDHFGLGGGTFPPLREPSPETWKFSRELELAGSEVGPSEPRRTPRWYGANREQ